VYNAANTSYVESPSLEELGDGSGTHRKHRQEEGEMRKKNMTFG